MTAFPVPFTEEMDQQPDPAPDAAAPQPDLMGRIQQRRQARQAAPMPAAPAAPPADDLLSRIAARRQTKRPSSPYRPRPQGEMPNWDAAVGAAPPPTPAGPPAFSGPDLRDLISPQQQPRAIDVSGLMPSMASPDKRPITPEDRKMIDSARFVALANLPLSLRETAKLQPFHTDDFVARQAIREGQQNGGQGGQSISTPGTLVGPTGAAGFARNVGRAGAEMIGQLPVGPAPAEWAQQQLDLPPGEGVGGAAGSVVGFAGKMAPYFNPVTAPLAIAGSTGRSAESVYQRTDSVPAAVAAGAANALAMQFGFQATDGIRTAMAEAIASRLAGESARISVQRLMATFAAEGVSGAAQGVMVGEAQKAIEEAAVAAGGGQSIGEAAGNYAEGIGPRILEEAAGGGLARVAPLVGAAARGAASGLRRRMNTPGEPPAPEPVSPGIKPAGQPGGGEPTDLAPPADAGFPPAIPTKFTPFTPAPASPSETFGQPTPDAAPPSGVGETVVADQTGGAGGTDLGLPAPGVQQGHLGPQGVSGGPEAGVPVNGLGGDDANLRPGEGGPPSAPASGDDLGGAHAPESTPAPPPRKDPARMSAKELRAAAQEAGVEMRGGRAETIRGLQAHYEAQDKAAALAAQNAGKPPIEQMDRPSLESELTDHFWMSKEDLAQLPDDQLRTFVNEIRTHGVEKVLADAEASAPKAEAAQPDAPPEPKPDDLDALRRPALVKLAKAEGVKMEKGFALASTDEIKRAIREDRAAAANKPGATSAPTEPAAASPPAALAASPEPWEMTRAEFAQAREDHNNATNLLAGGKKVPVDRALSDRLHRREIVRAQDAGKPVPPEVLADYPDLVPELKESPREPVPAPVNEPAPAVPAPGAAAADAQPGPVQGQGQEGQAPARQDARQEVLKPLGDFRVGEGIMVPTASGDRPAVVEKNDPRGALVRFTDGQTPATPTLSLAGGKNAGRFYSIQSPREKADAAATAKHGPLVVKSLVTGQETTIPDRAPQQAPAQGKEAIAGVAVKLDNGQVLTSGVRPHGTIDAPPGRKIVEEGFTTTTGRFVGRKEALEIAQKAQQTKTEDEAPDPNFGLGASDLETFANPPAAEPPSVKLARDIASRIGELGGGTMSWRDLFSLADKHFGGTQGEGKYTAKDAYDAAELAINFYIADFPTRFNPGDEPNINATVRARDAVRLLREITDRLPTQTKRDEDTVRFQQFSTPPAYAYLVNWAAGIRPGEVVVEPSAGNGGLAIFAKNAGADVHVNELAPDRRANLEALGFTSVSAENAEHLNAVLPPGIKPTVVVMNPPFSQTAGRLGDKRVLSVGASHIEQALERLEPGGRLVAIVGRGMSVDSPTHAPWFRQMGRQGYELKANIGVAGEVYRKYGTSFATRVLVFDKTGQASDPTKATQADVESLTDLVSALQEVRNGRNTSNVQRPAQPSMPEAAQPSGRPSAGPGVSAPPAPPVGDSGRGTQVDAGGQRPAAVGRPAGAGGPPAGPPAGGGVPGANPQPLRPQGQVAPGGGPGVGGSPAPQPPAEPAGVRGSNPGGLGVEAVRNAASGADESQEGAPTFQAYVPRRLKVPGAKPHPSPLSESAAMAAIEPPAPTYKPSLPKALIESGNVSEAQLEAVVYAGQAHNQMIPSGERRGAFIGDGPGVGKGATLSAILADNFNQGRRKAIWVSETQNLRKSADRDIKAVGLDPKLLKSLSDTKLGESIPHAEGILYTTYTTMASQKKGEGGEKQKLRLQQIVDWVGKDFDGVLIFDESHNMMNAVDSKGSRGIVKASQRATIGLDLQRMLPQARVVYSSATGAVEVRNLAYANRLGLWGPETPFDSHTHFIREIEAGGVAAMEQVAMELKARGLYLARQLSFQDPQGRKDMSVEIEPLDHDLTPEQKTQYDALSRAWTLVLNNIDKALEITADAGEGKLIKGARASALSKFYGTQLRFFNSVVTSLKVPSLIRAAEKDIAEGRAVIVQLTSTGEATQERRRAEASEDDDIDSLDLSPRDIIMQYVEKAFPTTKMEEYEDPETGNIRSRIVTDSKGNPVQDPRAIALREKLLEDLASVSVADSALDQLIDHFGPDKIAEVTGRSSRRVKSAAGREAKWENRSDAIRSKEVAEFNAGKRDILIFSEKGGTGESYHASRTIANQKRRAHYLLESGYKATKAIQGLGRAHRTNQSSAPLLRPISTDLKGEKRFISTISRRLGQMGALTRGTRTGAGGGLFRPEDNLESREAKMGLQNFYSDMATNRVEGIDYGEFSAGTGLELFDKDGGLKENLPPMSQFLNRLLALPIDFQNRLFDALQSRIDAQIQIARDNGTLDTGMEDIKALSAKVQGEQTVHTDPASGAESKMLTIETTQPVRLTPWSAANRAYKRYFRNATSGRIYGAGDNSATTEARTGTITVGARLYGPISNRGFVNNDELMDPSKWEKLSVSQAEAIWNEEYDQAPKTKQEQLHMLTGPLLPIWDKIGSQVKVRRIKLDGGDRVVGRVIDERELPTVMRNLGLKSEAPTWASNAAQALERVAAGWDLTLANGWRLKKSRVSGENRVEVVGPTPNNRGILENAGLLVERDGTRMRYFLPNGEAQPGVYGELMRISPVASAVPAGGAGGGGSGQASGIRSLGGGSGSNSAGQASGITSLAAPKYVHGAPGPRIPVDPIPDAGGKKIKDIVLDVSKWAPVRQGSPGRNAGGVYRPASTDTIIRFEGDLDTAAHEIGHQLDDRYNLVGQWNAKTKPGPGGRFLASPFDKELMPNFSGHGSGTKSGPRGKLPYHRAEGVAEWIRAYVVNPAAAKAAAPLFTAHFEAKVPAAVRAQIDAFGRDVRAHYGASPMEKTVANIATEMKPATVAQQVKAGLDRRNLDGNWIDRLGAAVVDSMMPVWRMVETAKELQGITDLPPTSDPQKVIRTHAGIDAKVARVFSEGMVDAQNNPIPGLGGLGWMLEPIKGSDPKQVQADFEAVQALMVSQRVIEKAQQFRERAQEKADEITSAAATLGGAAQIKAGIRAAKILAAAERQIQRMTGAGAGMQSDEQVAISTLLQLQADPKRLARLQEAAKRYRAHADAVLDYAVHKGFMSAEKRDEIRASNQFYVNMRRVVEGIADDLYGRGMGAKVIGGSAKKIIHTFTGGTRQIDNPYVNLWMQTAFILREADRNAALRTIRDVLHAPRSMYQGTPVDLAHIGRKVNSDEPDAVKIMVDGKAESWQFAPDMHRALKGWGVSDTPNFVQRVLRGMAGMLRMMVTLSPPFQLRNKIRDAQARGILSQSGARPWGEFYFLTPQGRLEFGSLMQEYELNGGANFGHLAQGREAWHEQLADELRKASGRGQSFLSWPGRMFRAYRRFGELLESLGRLDEYRKARAKALAAGRSMEDARLEGAYQARDLLDFAVGGTLTRSISQYVPFTNAAVQGLWRTARGAVSNPKGFWMRWAAYALFPTLAMYAWNSLFASKDDADEYADLPPMQRDFFYNYKIGPDTWVKVPKPFELGVMASGIERAIDAARGRKRALEGYGSGVVRALMPVDDQALLGPMRPFIEQMANKNFFTGGSIVPPWENDLDMRLRDASSASRVSQLVGDAVGIDPRRIDQYVGSQFGTVGSLVTGASDIGRDDKTGSGRKWLFQVSGLFSPSPAGASPDVRAVLEMGRKAGLSGTPAFQTVADYLKAIRDAGTSEEADQLKRDLRQYAAEQRDMLEEDGFLESVLGAKGDAKAEKIRAKNNR